MNIRQKIQSLIIALILSNILTGCYKDEGSYDYGILNEISVQSPIVGSRFAVDRYDEIEINPVLDFSGSIIPDDQLEFRWEMYIDDWANAEAKATVLGYEKNLKTIISRPASTDDYALMLTVTNKENGTSYQFKYALSVQPSVLSGIMVLQENRQGEMRLDYLASTNAEPAFAATRHLKDVYKTANNGANLSGKPCPAFPLPIKIKSLPILLTSNLALALVVCSLKANRGGSTLIPSDTFTKRWPISSNNIAE